MSLLNFSGCIVDYCSPLGTPQAGARLCKALGPEFLPYLPVVMPPLLAAARLEPEMKVHDPELEECEDDDDVEHIQLGDKVGVFCVTCVSNTGNPHSTYSKETSV
jgi:hypothetical protein